MKIDGSASDPSSARATPLVTWDLSAARGTHQVRVHIIHEHEHLTVTVRDTGSSDGVWVPGVGLASMCERAAEFGGSIDITANDDGSQVRALLPLR